MPAATTYGALTGPAVRPSPFEGISDTPAPFRSGPRTPSETDYYLRRTYASVERLRRIVAARCEPGAGSDLI